MLLLSHFHQPDRKRTFDYSPEIFCGNISKPFAYQTVKEFLIYRTVYHDTGYRTVNRINSFFQFIRFKFFFNFQVFGQKTGNAASLYIFNVVLQCQWFLISLPRFF